MLVPPALELLELSHIPNAVAPRVYAVGLPARRITFSDQQRRAINLVWALVTEERVGPGDQIAIVGAGVAGVTAAAYALERNLRPTLIEAHAEPFALQRGSGRWLHPNVYDWPNGSWDQRRTNFPVMNWTENSAVNVIAQLRTHWQAIEGDPRLTWLPNTKVAAIRSENTGVVVIEAGAEQHGPFKAALLTIGFGEEPDHPKLKCGSYWKDDDLHQRLRTSGTVLVSGCGDGGLIDCIRVLFRDYQHATLMGFARRAAAFPKLCADLREIERNTPKYPDGDALTDALVSLNVPGELDDNLRSLVMPHTNVLLNGSTRGPLNRGASLLNRFIVARLVRAGFIESHPGRLDVAGIEGVTDGYTVPIGTSIHVVRHVVVRHGPHPSATAAFPEIHGALQTARSFLQTYSAGIDRTRSPFWKIAYDEHEPLSGEPQNSAAMASYLAENIQLLLKNELLQLGHAPVFTSSPLENMELRMTVALGAAPIALTFHLPLSGELRVSVPADGGRSLSVTVAQSPLSAPHGALRALQAEMKEIAKLVLEVCR